MYREFTLIEKIGWRIVWFLHDLLEAKAEREWAKRERVT